MTIKRRTISTAELVAGVQSGDRVLLARAITLVESNAPAHQQQAQEMLLQLLPDSSNTSLRIGVTGVPGSGKSTFIEALGSLQVDQGERVAVLAVDPSSSRSGGSILGDKTRMDKLAQQEAAFIRPSPSGGKLGGVALKTRETMLLCEAAGYNIILVETVGVGQSEISVRSMVDFFLLLQIAGAGDELQGIKKGVIEICDAIAVNKADGDNVQRANSARQDFATALHYLSPVTAGWKSRSLVCSALTGEGIADIRQMIADFQQLTRKSGAFVERREAQQLEWLQALLHEGLDELFFGDSKLQTGLREAMEQIRLRQLTPVLAAQQLLQRFASGRAAADHRLS